MTTIAKGSVSSSRDSSKSKVTPPPLRIAEVPENEKLADRGLELLRWYSGLILKQATKQEQVKCAEKQIVVIQNEIEAAAWAHIIHLAEVGKIRMGITMRLGERRKIEDMWAEIEEQADELRPAADESDWDPAVLSAWPWVEGRLTPPTGWGIGEEGVRRSFKVDGAYPVAASAPMMITGRLRDIDTQQEQLRIEWCWPGEKPTFQEVPRATALSPQRLIHLTDRSAPIDGTILHDTVRYLRDFEAENRARLPIGLTCSRMGWIDVEGGGDRYVLGRSIIQADKVSKADSTRSPADWSADHIHLSTSGGRDELASAHRTSGSYDGWSKQVATPASRYPAVMLTVYAGLVPPLMRYLPALPNAILDLSGRTSQGKSTAQYVAASVYGYPDERGGILSSWANTAFWMESTAAFLDGLPMFLGDTRNAEGGKLDPALISSTIYTYAQGRGSGRGSYAASGGGTRSAGQWRGVLIFTGEVSAVSLTEQGGTRARVLSLHGSPFGSARPGLGDEIKALKTATLTHHGHFAQRYVQHLMQPGMADRIQAMHTEAEKRWSERVGDSPILHRSCPFLAALEVAAMLAHEIGLPGSPDDALTLAWAALSEGAQDGDRPRAALQAIYEWAHSQRHRFEGADHRPTVDCLGVWTEDQLAIYPEKAKEHLKHLGYDVDTTIRSWIERGWLSADPGRADRKTKMSNGRPRLLCVRSEVLREHAEGSDGE